MATDWDAHYRAGDTPWDKGAAAPPLLEWLEPSAHRFGGAVLVPGCGQGHDVRAIAATGQATEVCGIDLSPTAIHLARQFAREGNERYLHADLFDLPAELPGKFDWVFEHTCFCAIHPSQRREYVRAVAEALKVGGHLLAVFYLTPWQGKDEKPPEGGPPFATDITELDALFRKRFRLMEEYVPSRAFPGREGQELVRLLRKKE